MDNIDESTSFFKHVFNFDDDSKYEVLNILQYAFIAIIPIVFLNKVMQKYVPEADETKGSLEISIEILIQISTMLFGMFIINRIITYIPTYSNVKYPEYHVIYNILAILMITMSLQTKLGEKVSILADRAYELWDGKQSQKSNNSNGKITVTQPIAGQQYSQVTTPVSTLPSYDTQPQPQPQQSPNFNAMYQPTADTQQSGMYEGMEPNDVMAANGVLGGGSWGSW